jgi:hypothetical protein
MKLAIPMNLSFFGEEPPAEPDDGDEAKPDDVKPPEKTFTKAELDAREASARKAARDAAQREFAKMFGVDSIDKDTAETIKAALANAENSKSVEEKNAKMHEEMKQLKAMLSEQAHQNELTIREMTLNQNGITGKLAKTIAKGLSASTADGDSFNEEIEEIKSIIEAMTKAKEKEEKQYGTQGNPSPPPMAGAKMGKTPDKATEKDAEAFKARLEKATKIGNTAEVVKIITEAQQKGITLAG